MPFLLHGRKAVADGATSGKQLHFSLSWDGEDMQSNNYLEGNILPITAVMYRRSREKSKGMIH